MNKFLANREYHLIQMSHALFQAKQAFLDCATLEDEQKVCNALGAEFLRAYRDLVGTCVDDFTHDHTVYYLEGIEEKLIDDTDGQFMDAIDRRDYDASDQVAANVYQRAIAEARRQRADQ